ncbi:MAG: hypothetical protein ACNI3A_11735 [Desulfovibrio sp.]|jgi:hypothetical protein|uniref:hypothetical protein n=1 Tax=Desulfovibrio sp. 7SRBS1 TaxID=3378064 RepID=UPI003B3CCA6C
METNDPVRILSTVNSDQYQFGRIVSINGSLILVHFDFDGSLSLHYRDELQVVATDDYDNWKQRLVSTVMEDNQ